MYSLHETGLGMCSNNLEGVAFASLRNFTRGAVSQGGTLCNLSSHGPALLQM